MNQSSIKTFTFVSMASLSVLIFCSSLMAQGFSMEGYLKRKDVNQNGKIEPEEMSENTKNQLTKMGFDPKKSVSISKVKSKFNKAKTTAAKKTARSNTVAKVPGFGVSEESKATVSDFSFNSSSKVGTKSAPVKYSSKVMEQVESTLQRYDRNKDGSLDRTEMRSARWGSPAPETNDLNKDGRLSRDELAKRYAGREQYYASRSNSSAATSKDAEADRARREKERERWRSSGRTSSTSSASRYSSSSARSSSRPVTSSAAAPKVDRSKYLKYAQSLVENYDKDKDGKLSKTEVKAMRRPPVGADVDKDGFITENELVDSLSGANKSKTASSTASKSSTKSSSRYSSRSSSGSSRTASRTGAGSFEKLDSNSDNQVQMHEYSEEWDDEMVAEFYAKDKNSDGVITLKEWSSKN